MANPTSAINIQVDTKTKQEATTILNDLGLSMSSAINIFLKQIIKNDGLPFEIKNHTPSKEMKKALKEADDIISGKKASRGYHDIHQMIEDILNED